MAKPSHTSLNIWVVFQNPMKSRFDHTYGLMCLQGFQNRFQNEKRRLEETTRASGPLSSRAFTRPGGQGRVASLSARAARAAEGQRLVESYAARSPRAGPPFATMWTCGPPRS